MAKPKDIFELRDQILESVDKLKADPRRHNQVKEEINGYGKALAACKVIQDHCAVHGLENDDPFMKGVGGKPLKTPKLLNS